MSRRHDGTIHKVVPWGRTYDEYVRMFALSEEELGLSILGCADGPASFNCEMHSRGKRVVSIDPIYDLPAEIIWDNIDEARDLVVANTKTNMDAYVWEEIPSLEALVERRLSAMKVFLEDYERGRAEGRYLAHSLPDLPFSEGEFEIALCSHFLFIYSEQFSEDDHFEFTLEMARVAKEVRIFPLMGMNGPPCPYLEPLTKRLRDDAFAVDIVPVPYEFLIGGNRMMRISRP